MDIVAISPVTKSVALGSAAVEVTGLSFRKLVHLAVGYPEFLPLVAGGNANLAKLLFDAPELALAIFSVGVVGPARRRGLRFWKADEAMVRDDAKLLAAFDAAPAGQQIDALGTIYDLTFKGERAIPFLKMVGEALKQNQPTPPEPGPEPSSS